MDVYGLTGGIGSGKSTVAALLEEYGVPVVSADELSRIVVAKGSDGLRDVVAEFGAEVLDEAEELDRAKMASIVFRDPDRRRRLEEILHPRIRERFEQVLDALEKAGHTVTVYEVPLLFEKNLQREMKAVILVTAPDSVRIARVRSRDDVTETEVRARMSAQMDEASKRRRADYIIENDGNVDELRREVEFLLARFLRIAEPMRRAGAWPEVAPAEPTPRPSAPVTAPAISPPIPPPIPPPGPPPIPPAVPSASEAPTTPLEVTLIDTGAPALTSRHPTEIPIHAPKGPPPPPPPPAHGPPPIPAASAGTSTVRPPPLDGPSSRPTAQGDTTAPSKTMLPPPPPVRTTRTDPGEGEG